ncbi:sialin-like [Antedon mediterranea]|uniref:sialin-like n=1 Tax=Antedon mediterranea TaxID=105859 RepID=UPI003AF437C7
MVRQTDQTILQPENKAEIFDWNIETQQLILGVFYYGFAASPIFGGWLVGRYGGFRVLLAGVSLSSLMMLLTQLTARLNLVFLMINRIIDGIGQGIVYPSIFGIIVNWSQLNERSTFISITTSGLSIGAVLTGYVSTWLGESSVFGGWPSTFYVYGMLGALWCITWYFIGSSRAANHPWISDYERNLILQWQPEEVNSGLLTVGPNVAFSIVIIFGGIIMDKIISSGRISILSTRKLYICVGFGLSSILLVLIGYVANDVMLSVVLTTLVFGVYGLGPPAIGSNTMDIAPNHAGLLIGIIYAVTTTTGFIAPAVVGLFTHTHNTIYQWRIIFCIVPGLQIFGVVAFMIFGSGEVQDWATNCNDEDTESIDDDHPA